MVEQVFAGLGLLLCALVAVGLWLGPVRRERLLATLKGGWRWRRTQSQARREAARAIERARRRSASGRWEGNVFRPTSFKEPQGDDRPDA